MTFKLNLDLLNLKTVIRSMSWSVVIPTLWKSDYILDLLILLNDSNFVDEIIIIDNNFNDRKNILQSKKIKIIEQEKNIFVNPAWNLGVELAKNNLVCLCNDDIIFDPKLFEIISNQKLEKQIIGCHFDCFNGFSQDFHLINGHSIGDGWGCLLFFQKKYFVPIPNSYKIWCGDDWLVSHFLFTKSLKWPILTKMSESSNLPNLNSIAIQDKVNFLKNSNERDLKRISKLRTINLSKPRLFKELYFWYVSIVLKT
jgi:hypothetical protein